MAQRIIPMKHVLLDMARQTFQLAIATDDDFCLTHACALLEAVEEATEEQLLRNAVQLHEQNQWLRAIASVKGES